MGKRLGEKILEALCLIELKEISVTPPVMNERLQPQSILKDVNIRVHKGEWITVIGRNGSGKSTLAKVTAGLRMAGVKGKQLRNKEILAHGRQIPIVMQQPEASMIGATPWEDVVIMLEQNGEDAATIIERAEQALNLVGMASQMHQSIETLSGGQKQLVAIAGCFAVGSPLLFLDEVTAMLDPEAASFVLNQVRALHQSGITVLWITQKLEELRPGDRIFAINEGSIVYDGEADGWFSRSDAGATDSLCERLGFEAPYTVQVAWSLESQGIKLRPFPFTAEMLAQAVKRYEQ